MLKKIRFSQHFLRNQKILHKISQVLEITPKDLIIEIGGGHGELTKFLLNAGKVIVYEIDPKLAKSLQTKFPKIEVRQQDFLKANVSQYQHNYKLVGNIPYAITGQIFRKVLQEKNYPKLLVFTLQKEVAEKMLAKPRANFWSHWLSIWGKVEKVLSVPAKYFQPKPKVDSMVIKITFFSKPLVENPENFAKFLKKLFAYPKRKLKNQLIKVPESYQTKRPFELTLDEILAIFYKIIYN